MDCPICYEPITSETGCVTTSCSHTFHFKCLNTWYWRQTQNEDTKETCPCCRKEPGEFERASTITDTDTNTVDDAESESMSEESEPEWIQVAPRRWVIASSAERLQILATVAAEQDKIEPYHIPPYNEEAHALWNLRTLFEERFEEPASPHEEIHSMDRPKYYRRRRRSYGRSFWVHLGMQYTLAEIDGYKTD